jgi:HSP20 family molecular chaperone IbpA
MVDLVKRDPFRSIFSWPRWLDEWEEEFQTLTTSRGLRIHEDEKNIYVDAVVAGVPADDVQVDIEDGVVTIKAEKKHRRKEKERI